MNEKQAAGLAEIRTKLELLKRVQDEHRFDVLMEEGGELEPIPELPDGVVEVFSLFSRLRGSSFLFLRPADIASPRAWAERAIDPYCPLGVPLCIGYEQYGMPEPMDAGNHSVYLDTDDGSVYTCDPDDYVFAYKSVDEEVETRDLAPDVVTFVNDSVLGGGYPSLVDSFLGPGAAHRRDRKGRHRDSWMRLLVAAGAV
ncbi:hypothetical protein ACFVH6_13950 [Spirillospora sp. NPDC127200]